MFARLAAVALLMSGCATVASQTKDPDNVVYIAAVASPAVGGGSAAMFPDKESCEAALQRVTAALSQSGVPYAITEKCVRVTLKGPQA